jgi:transcriptional regulator with XRE-family HTH domain
MTQEELARRVGVTQSYIARLEAGLDNPSLPVVLRFAKTFKISVGYLVE